MNEGKILPLSQAAQEHGMSKATLSSYVDAGLVRVHTRPEKRGQAMLVFADDVRKIAEAPVSRGNRGHVTRLKEYLSTAS